LHAQERDKRGVLHVAPECDKHVEPKPDSAVSTLDVLGKMSKASHPSIHEVSRHRHVVSHHRLHYREHSKGRRAIWSTTDKGTIFIVELATLNTTYNTLRTTERTRAGKVLISTVLPFLRTMPSAPPKNVDGVAVIITYGKKDFSEVDTKPDGEAVCLLAKRDSIAKLLAGEITDDDFVATGNVYSYSGSTFSQLKVTLE
jgi:hypothetical protein